MAQARKLLVIAIAHFGDSGTKPALPTDMAGDIGMISHLRKSCFLQAHTHQNHSKSTAPIHKWSLPTRGHHTKPIMARSRPKATKGTKPILDTKPDSWHEADPNNPHFAETKPMARSRFKQSTSHQHVAAPYHWDEPLSQPSVCRSRSWRPCERNQLARSRRGTRCSGLPRKAMDLNVRVCGGR